MTQVTITGLRELRGALRATGAGLPRELSKQLRLGAGIAAARARELAPRRSGRLAASVRPGGAGLRAFIRSDLDYAGVQEHGGTISHTGPRHHHDRPHRLRIRAQPFMAPAVEQTADEVATALEQGLRDLARRHGLA